MKQAEDTATIDLVGRQPREVSETRYDGGKNGAGVYQAIINCIPRHAVYIEAFAGSASIFRNKAPASSSVLIERDPAQAELLKRRHASSGVEVLQGDAFVLLPRLIPSPYDGPGVFVYLDPPYHPHARRDADLYRYELDAADHEELLHELLPNLSARGVRWALSGYRCTVYDDAQGFHGWHRLDYTAQTRRGPVTESLWTNFDPAMVDLHDHRYIGRDFRERERIARKVQRWVGKLEKLPHHERGAIMTALASIAASGGARSTDCSSTARSGERIRRGV